jgi:hypothetical protein
VGVKIRCQGDTETAEIKYLRQMYGRPQYDHTVCSDLKTFDLEERIQKAGLSCTEHLLRL